MPSLNSCNFIGHLARDPELRYTANGQATTQFSLAVNRNYKGADGEWKEEVEWVKVVCWAALAERAAEQLTKGKMVYVEGRMQTRTWDDKDGQKHYTTEIIANKAMSLSLKAGETTQDRAPASDDLEDLPF